LGFFTVAGGLFLYAGRHSLWRLLTKAGGRDARPEASAETNTVSPFVGDTSSHTSFYEPGQEPVELPFSLARRLAAEPINSRTVQALRLIASSPTPEFHMKNVIDGIPGAKGYLDVRGIWSG
jgi:hypothetical protein